MASSGNRLKQTLRALVRRRQKTSPSLDPGCAFGVVVEERLKEVERSLQETRARVNALIFLVIAAVLEQLIMRLFL